MELIGLYLSLFFPCYLVFLVALYQYFRKFDSDSKIKLRDFFKYLGKKKRTIVDIVGKKVLITLGVIIGCYILYFVADAFILNVYRTDRVAETQAEIYDIINEGILKGKGKIKFKSSFSPEMPDINRVIADAEAPGNYNGGEIWELNYSTEFVSENEYNITVTLSDPNPIKGLLVKIRAWRIAGHYEDLSSDYEKVKAVHDYVAGVDSFGRGDGGVFNALFNGKSSSVGYAYAFYAIMDQIGIPATVEAGADYVWNSVKIDGKWYNIDCMRDDPLAGGPSYGSFLKCNEDWKRNPYGTSDAEESLEVRGKSAEEYYDMVPNYRLHRLLFELFLFLAPLVICLVMINRKEEHERDIQGNSLMNINNWHYMSPGKVFARYNVVVKKSYEPIKSETWYEENDRFFIFKTEGQGKKVKYETVEIDRDMFVEEVNFLVKVSEINMADDYNRLLVAAAERLNITSKQE